MCPFKSLAFAVSVTLIRESQSGSSIAVWICVVKAGHALPIPFGWLSRAFSIDRDACLAFLEKIRIYDFSQDFFTTANGISISLPHPPIKLAAGFETTRLCTLQSDDLGTKRLSCRERWDVFYFNILIPPFPREPQFYKIHACYYRVILFVLLCHPYSCPAYGMENKNKLLSQVNCSSLLLCVISREWGKKGDFSLSPSIENA